MKAHRKIEWALPAMIALLFAAMGTAQAADGTVTAGTQWWDQTEREAKFEEFRDIPNGPFLEEFVLLDTLWKGRLALYGRDAFQNDQASTVLYRRPRWTAGIEYTRVPHNFSFIARTPFSEIAPGVLVLPDSVQRTVQENAAGPANAALLDLVRNSGRVPLGFRTDMGRGRLKARFAKGVQLDVIGTRRQREGTKAYGFSFGFSNALEVPEPINQTMVQGEARLSYAFKKVALEAIGGLEAFENDVDALVVDNPRRYTDGTAGSSRGRLDLYPDNRTLRGALKAGIQLPRRTALTAFVQLSQIVQDDKWLPLTINTALLQPDTFPLPGTNTAGKVNVLTTDLRLSGSPMEKVSGTLRFRRYDYDNKTEQHLLPGQVAYDQSWQPADVETDPIGFTWTTFGADADFKPLSRLTLTGTVEHNQRERSFREIGEDKELVFQGRARFRPRNGLELTGRYRHGDREQEHFDYEHYENAAGNFIEQPTLRRYDVGDRKQEQAVGEVGWIPTERVHLSAVYEYLRNEFEDKELEDSSLTQLGLLDEARRTISLEGTFDLTERIALSSAYGWGQVYAHQRSRQSSTATLALADSANWSARLKDWFIYLNGQVTWRPILDRLAITGTYELQRAPSVYILRNFANTAIDLPTTKYRREGVGAEAWYRVDPGFSVGARWAWEQYEVTDFATENVPLLFPTTGNSNAIFLGDSILDYKAHILGLMIRRTF